MYKTSVKTISVQMPIPNKLFYKIGEVSKIAAVEPYVLRYWETEFVFLKPRKNKSGQRVYVKKDIETILQIRKYLYQERYTIEGVRKRLSDGNSGSNAFSGSKQAPTPGHFPASKVVEHVKQRLKDILKQL
jgi:DNA-binding transcriptional MerR regulator